jgi:hypothetical protein
MFKHLALALCIGYLNTICASENPSAIVANSILRYLFGNIEAYWHEDEHCEWDKELGIYAYGTRGFPPENSQLYYKKRFDVLKAKFQHKD